jgi:hypothetical protein
MKKQIGLVFLILQCLAIVQSFTGCTSSKFLETKSKDSVVVAVKDSGAIKTNTSTSRNNDEWWREILEYSLNKKDTNVVNVFNPPIEVGQPIVRIIREGGRNDNESKTIFYDSSWKNSLDSLRQQVTEKKLEKETEVFGVKYALVIAAAVVLILILLMVWIQYNANKHSKTIVELLNKLK